MQLITALLLFLTIVKINATYQAVNWPLLTDIKSGDHKLLLQPLNQTIYTYTQYWTGFTFSAAPYVALAMRDLKINPATSGIDFKVEVMAAGIKNTQFTTTVTTFGNFTLTYMYYMYIIMTKTYADKYYYYFSEDLTSVLNNTSSINTNIIKSISNITITSPSSARVMPYFVSFALGTNSTEYSIATSGTMVNSSSISINIDSNSSLTRIQLMVIVVDVYTYTIGFKNFLDYGILQNFNSGATYTTKFSAPTISYFNLIMGITSMKIPRSSAINFQYSAAQQKFTTTTSYTYLKVEILQWRTRVCTLASMPYYTFSEQLCYDNCSSSTLYKYGENATYLFCAVCNTNCLTCTGDSLCSTCNANDSRSLNSATKACDCNTGFYDAGFSTCLTCDYSCRTCVNSSSTCTDCPAGRTLTNTSCLCNTGTYDNLTNSSTCATCDSKCQKCLNSSTNCTSCSNTTNRILDQQNWKCPCSSGFIENGSAICIVTPLTCQLPCVTCSLASTNCTSCNLAAQRVLTNSQCVCKTGFTSTSTTACKQTCGTGNILSSDKQCDDGNANTGDGCSSSCAVQSGFTCTNSNSTNPASICLSNGGYTISTQSLSRDTSTNKIFLTVSFSPTPPSSITPTLTNLQSQLSLQSYSFSSSSSTMSMSINILSDLTNSDPLLASFSLINQTTSVSLSADNRLELRPYSNFQLTSYKIEVYLIWIYIGFIWAGAIVFVGFLDAYSFNGICQLFTFAGLAWIGIQGQQIYSLLFLPMRSLRYIFGPNLQLGNQDTLFDVFNVGSFIFLLPVLGFILVIFINKKKSYYVSTRVKRFVLFDLLYGWMMVNGLLIAYGLGLITHQAALRTIDIGGILFGVIYLAICMAASYKLFFGAVEVQINPKLEITKKNMYRPRIYSVISYIYIIFSLMYTAIYLQTKLNSLIMMGFLLIVFIFFALGNILINKIKYMLNLVIMFLMYGCILLYNNVSSAIWCGLAFTALLYLQLALNFAFLAFEKSNNKLSGSSVIQQQLQKLSENNNLNKIVVNIEREPQEMDQIEASDKSALQAHYENHFTVYEPTIKKPPQLQIMIPAPELLYETNAIETAIKTYSNRSERDRLLDKRFAANDMTTPVRQRPAREVDDDLADIGSRLVPMDAI